jgi:hypothetical protein
MQRLAAIAVVVSGCGATPPPPPSNTPPPLAANGTVIDHLRAYRDDMCECNNRRCVRDVEREMKSWEERHKDLANRRAHTSVEGQLDDELSSCRSTAMAGGPGPNPMMDKMKGFTTQMCACADQGSPDCAKRVTDEMSKWASENANKVDADAEKPTDEDMKVVKQFTDCATKAMTATPPTP